MTRALRFLVCCFVALALPLQGWAAHVECTSAQMEHSSQAMLEPGGSMHEDCAAHHAPQAAKVVKLAKGAKTADKCSSGACCCHAVAMGSTGLLIEPRPATPVAVAIVPLAHASVPLAGIEKPPRAELA